MQRSREVFEGNAMVTLSQPGHGGQDVRDQDEGAVHEARTMSQWRSSPNEIKIINMKDKYAERN